ncbi:hypothetical protein ACFOPQ_04510 [Deinococcus antarcticus]|uniref:ATP-binding protein n=1 Tax=Deinococcus antarcticus TaxID=1298767 RepID=A0ABV8A479_9DEIO
MTSPTPQELTTAPSRYLRSVRLESDLHAAQAPAGYVITPQVRLVLRRILTALKVEGADRALTLTGPYGTGKSAFALYLSRLVNDPKGDAFRLLQKVDPALAHEVSEVVPRPLLPVPLTLRRARLSTLLIEGLARAASTFGEGKTLAQRLEQDLLATEDGFDSQAVLRAIDELKTAAVSDGYGGLVIIFDELGKGLEFEARYGSDDIYLLQELAEVAVRSGSAPLLFIGVLHQGFEQYGEHLMASARKEWGKVQGRFADIAFLEPPEQQMRLAAQAIQTLEPTPSKALREQAQQAAQALTDLEQAPKTIGALEFVTLAGEASPLHPTALIALPFLFRRFAQNERSLFAYLLSGEPHAVPALWAARSGQELVRLSDLFDYFVENLLPSLSRHLYARRWLEVLDAVQREPDLQPLDVQTLKTIGLLGILGDLGALHATFELICVTLRDEPDSAEVRASLDRLSELSLIVHRSYNHTYRIWEGSDIDIEAKLEEGRRTASASLALSEILEKHLPRRPLVARRHSFDTGTLRFIELHYADTPGNVTAIRPDAGGEGVLLCALPSSLDEAEAFKAWATSPEVTAREDLIVVIPQQLSTLREAAIEVRALHWLKETTPELRDDRVARREVAERLAQMEAVLSSNVEQLIDPRPLPQGSQAAYWYTGEEIDIPTPRAAAQFLSEVLDALYHESPRILNELINRRLPSSAAAAGRRNLIDAMFDPVKQRQERLGMDVDHFMPERSMYESILREGQIHTPVDPSNEGGEWQFVDPPAKHHTNLTPTWNALAEAIFGATKPLSVATLFQQLNAPPYGLTAGLFPIILAAFMQAHPHEISFYREGTFVPEPSIADLEVLMRRPELFAVMGSELKGARAAVIQRMARGYKTEPALVPVVRALYKGVKSLPDTAQRTKRLPETVLKLRETFNQARSPEQLLFMDIPDALGLPHIPDADTPAEDIEAFFSALNAANTTWAEHAPKQTKQARAALLNAFGFPPNNQGWQALIEQAQQLQDRPLPTSLTPLISRLSASGDQHTVLDGVLALVAGRSPRSWTDTDAERFPTQVKTIAQTYRVAAEQLGHTSPDVKQQSTQYTQQLRATLNLDPTTLSTTDKAALRLALIKRNYGRVRRSGQSYSESPQAR